uniref:Mediator of RNA polymerase II transcription subunit 20 n=1 Tax=Phallusia mammillata TaxID=59560 RepID=A0A6F9DJX2_9ASCI|nr:mediator of RNA polymerase II transcription subunit 20-like [Phallusia mammillata]
MGVTYICQWKQPEGQNIQQSIEQISSCVEKLGAKKAGLFQVECESFNAPNAPNAKTLHLIYDSEFPASRFALFEEGSFLVTDVMLSAFLSKLRAVWQPKKGGKIDCKGQRYELGDFLIKLGVVSVGASAKGISVELEYAPCVYARDCWGMMSEMLQSIIGEQAPPSLPSNLQPKGTERFSPELTMQQYVEMFNNIRKTVVAR